MCVCVCVWGGGGGGGGGGLRRKHPPITGAYDANENDIIHFVQASVCWCTSLFVLQVDELADHLNIYIFSTKKPPAKASKVKDWGPCGL